MAKPIINRIVPFDANYDKIISMTYYGSLPYSNRVIVYNAESMSVVFDDTVESFNMTHIIPASTLKNGTKYAIQGQAFDADGVASSLSDKVYFLCLETPTFHFTDISDGDTIKSSFLNVNVMYEQSDWEDIKEYQFHLYDANKKNVHSSNMLYDIDNISYSFNWLENNTIYYIRCTGVTDNGISLDTGYVKLFISYENPNNYAHIYAECDERLGVVNGYTNFNVIESSSTGEYEYENGFIDLIGKTIVYEKDFLIENDFTITLRIKNAFHEGIIMTSRNDKYGFTLSSHIYDEGKMRYKLTVSNGLCNYILYSDELVLEDSDIVTVHIRRINNVYGIYGMIEYGTTEQANMWFGTTRPSLSQMSQYDIWIDMDNESTIKVNKDDVEVFYSEQEPDTETSYALWIGGE